jgi:hypothetical protein
MGNSENFIEKPWGDLYAYILERCEMLKKRKQLLATHPRSGNLNYERRNLSQAGQGA